MVINPTIVVNLQHKLDSLRKDHHRLEDQIDDLRTDINLDASNTFKIHQLKKQKLAIKDKIVKIEALMTPDIIA